MSMKEMVSEWVGASVLVPIPLSGGRMQMVCTVKDVKQPYGSLRLLVAGRTDDVRGEAWIVADGIQKVNGVKA